MRYHYTTNTNYITFCQGKPFMESLTQNRTLLFSLVGNFAVILLLACGFLPNFAMQFEIVDFPSQVSFPRKYITKLNAIYLLLNLFATYVFIILACYSSVRHWFKY